MEMQSARSYARFVYLPLSYVLLAANLYVLLVVVPQFARIYDEMLGTPLPLTMAVVAVSCFALAHPFLVIPAALLAPLPYLLATDEHRAVVHGIGAGVLFALAICPGVAALGMIAPLADLLRRLVS